MLYFIYWLFKFIEASAQPTGSSVFFEMEVAEKTFKMEIFRGFVYICFAKLALRRWSEEKIV